MTDATPTSNPFHAVAAQEGEVIWFNGALITIKVPGDWSHNAFSLVEVASTRGRATGLHTDPSHETFYVLEGELLFHVDGQEHHVRAGQTVAVQSGVAHAFLILSNVARFLVLNTPGTHDRFFREGGEPAAHRDHAKAPPPNHERTMRAAHACGVRFLGPPPFDATRVSQTSG